MIKVQELAKRFKKIGREYWGRKASGLAFCCVEDGTILLAQRSGLTGGKWGVIGGAVGITGEGIYESESHKFPDPSDEVFLASAEREVEEELGNMPNVGEKIGETTFKDGGFTYKTFVFNLTKEEKERWTPTIVIEKLEHQRVEWFPINQLPDNLHPGVDFVLKQMAKQHELFKSYAEDNPEEKNTEEEDEEVVGALSSLPQVSPTTYAGQILMKIGYTGIEYDNSIIVFDPSNVQIVSVSVNPFGKKKNKEQI
jgi:8-oxo-dGTP pyrophosphatase MutT (NUDIX family)